MEISSKLQYLYISVNVNIHHKNSLGIVFITSAKRTKKKHLKGCTVALLRKSDFLWMVSTILMEWPDKTDRKSIWLFPDVRGGMDRISKVKYDDNIRKMYDLAPKIIHSFSCILFLYHQNVTNVWDDIIAMFLDKMGSLYIHKKWTALIDIGSISK